MRSLISRLHHPLANGFSDLRAGRLFIYLLFYCGIHVGSGMTMLTVTEFLALGKIRIYSKVQ